MEYIGKLKELGITIDKNGKQLCPQCSDSRKKKKEPSLSVTYGNDGVLYNCHNDGCDFNGKVFYTMRATTKKHYKKPQPPRVIAEDEKMVEWFKSRGISKDILDKYQIKYTQKHFPQTGENENCIAFPYYKHGELVNIKYRSGRKAFTQERDTEKTFFGMDFITEQTTELIICEGEIDVLSLAMAGTLGVSVPQGATEDKLECINNCYDWLQRFDSFIIIADNDKAGDKLKANLINRLGEDKCKEVNLGRWNDPNEILVNKGAGELKEVIKSASYISSENIIDFDDDNNFYKVMKFYDYGLTKGFSTGWSKLDEIFTIKPGYLMVVTGFPSCGKSEWVENLLLNLSEQYGWKHLIASFEAERDIFYGNMGSRWGKKQYSARIGWSPNELSDYHDFFNSHFKIVDPNKYWNIGDIIKETRLAVRRYGVKTLVIDPYSCLDATPPKEIEKQIRNETDYIKWVLGRLKALARELGILVIFVAHPAKPFDDKPPTLYSISGSAHWKNFADYGVVVHRYREMGRLKNQNEIRVEKIKNRHIGNPAGGVVMLKFYETQWRLYGV